LNTKDAGGALKQAETISDWEHCLKISRRNIERMLAAGKIPRPDVPAGRLLRWKPGTIARWIDGHGEKAEG